MYPSRQHLSFLLRPTAALAAVLLLAFLAAGCGGGPDEMETDPETMPSAEEGMEEVELEEQPFEGGALEGGGVAGEDVEGAEAAEPAILLQDVFFDYDKFELDQEDRQALNQNARLLREHPSARILIEGHCDERGTVQYNLALGEKRAREVRSYLVDLGIDGSRIDVVSYGKERPFVLGHDEEAWAQNRRAHFVIR